MSRLLDALGYVGDSLDKPGRSVRGLLGGRPQELMALLPFSDSLGLTDPGDAVSGRDLLGSAGLGTGNDTGDTIAGMIAEALLDPTNYLGGFAVRGVGRGIEAARAANASRLGSVFDNAAIGAERGFAQKHNAAREYLQGVNTARDAEEAAAVAANARRDELIASGHAPPERVFRNPATGDPVWFEHMPSAEATGPFEARPGHYGSTVEARVEGSSTWPMSPQTRIPAVDAGYVESRVDRMALDPSQSGMTRFLAEVDKPFYVGEVPSLQDRYDLLSRVPRGITPSQAVDRNLGLREQAMRDLIPGAVSENRTATPLLQLLSMDARPSSTIRASAMAGDQGRPIIPRDYSRTSDALRGIGYDAVIDGTSRRVAGDPAFALGSRIGAEPIPQNTIHFLDQGKLYPGGLAPELTPVPARTRYVTPDPLDLPDFLPVGPAQRVGSRSPLLAALMGYNAVAQYPR